MRTSIQKSKHKAKKVINININDHKEQIINIKFRLNLEGNILESQNNYGCSIYIGINNLYLSDICW